MNPGDFPAPKEGFVITHVLVVADQDRARESYRSLLGGQVLLERDPVIIHKVANTWLTLVTGGGPTDDKPGVSLSTPRRPRTDERVPQRARGGHRQGLRGVVGERRRVPD